MPKSVRLLAAAALVGASLVASAAPREGVPASRRPMAVPAVPPAELQYELLYDHVKTLSDRHDDLPDGFAAWREALAGGSLDEAATWTLVAAADDVEVQAKIELLLRRFAGRALRGEPGMPFHEMPPEVRPPSLRDVVQPEAPPSTKALCNTCASASLLPPPTPACRLVGGNTTSACPSDFYSVDLEAGVPVVFTLCQAQCSGASAPFDARLRVRGPGCAILFDSDDFCGLLPQITFVPPSAARYGVEVTGFTNGSFGRYTLGYKTLPVAACGTCAAPLQTLVPTPACQAVSGAIGPPCQMASTSTSAVGGAWYAVQMTAGHCYSFSTCPSIGGAAGCQPTATFDTRLDLWNPTCTTRVGGNDDISCSLIFRSAFTFIAPTSGTYKLQVRGFSNDSGSYTLAYSSCSGCTEPPVIASAVPSVGSSGAACSRSQAFQVTLSSAAAAPAVGTFTITPGPGAAAVPASGSFGFSSATGTFTSRLTKPPCGDATFDVSVDVTSDCGSTTTSWTYELRDTSPPRFTGCPSGQALDCAAPDPPPPSPTAVDGCDPAPTISFSETQVSGPCAGRFTTRRTWTAEDCEGNASTCVQNLVHRDTTAPALSGSDDFCLWPLDHQLHCLQVSSLPLTWAEDCSEPVAVRFVGCVSSEPDSGTGDEDWAGDCLISPDGQTACLRAERATDGTARTYSVLAVATDACGNASAPVAVATVTVPGDDAPHPECRASNSGYEPPF